ncbi:reverse transcriptase family protein [Anatilimnocola sp. NA78]|uniref:reverse transcriptase family protein n=1 Tax=Anatilimnocola sp. NA78 TaxID=3415683 RepID=UPI003CE5AB7F
MPALDSLSRTLATVFLAGEWSETSLIERGGRLLGKKYRWLKPLVKRLCGVFPAPWRPRRFDVERFIATDESFVEVVLNRPRWAREFLFAPPMLPLPPAQGWNLPSLVTVGQLAAWLQVSVRELEWLADCRGFEAKCSPNRVRNYHYRLLTKRFGQSRLIEAPKERLKAIQRQLLIEILEPIPLHDAAHGFRSQRSIVSFASPHVAQAVVLKIDLQDFFPSISAARVRELFRFVGYPESVAQLLTGLCTNTSPTDVWDSEQLAMTDQLRMRSLYARPHLPQGAPTSPAIANLCAYRLDCRLSTLAQVAGGTYTRYADDLAFSGGRDFVRGIDRFQIQACVIAAEEGFAVHHRKTRIMRPGVRQQLAGLVVNQHLNPRRDDYDLLKATLTNCLRHGAASQNRQQLPDFRAHLLGRISYFAMINPTRAGKLQKLFDQIQW